MKYSFLLICIMVIVGTAAAQDIVHKNNVDISTEPGISLYHPNGLNPVNIETMINGERFQAANTNEIDTNIIKYSSGEKAYLVFDDPIVQQQYQTFDNGSLEETLVLKEKKDVSWNIDLTPGDELQADDDGSYHVIHPGADSYIDISQPVGYDANGERITYSYRLGEDGHTLILSDPGDVAYPVTIDPTISQQFRIVLLLHNNLESVDGYATNVFRDSSRYFDMGTPHGLTPPGPKIDLNVSQKIYGNASLFSKNYSNLSFPDSDRFTFSNSNFSVSGWIFYPTTASITQSIIWQHLSSAANFELLNAASPTVITFTRMRGSADIGSCSATLSSPLTTSKWYHLAFIQNGATGTLYLNGSSVATCTRTASMTDISAPVEVGNFFSGSYGFVDEVMVVNDGDAMTINDLYNGQEYPLFLNSTPTNTGYADDNSTVSLLHFDGANGGSYFHDQVGNRSWQPFNSVTTATFQNKFGTAGANFAGVAPNITIVNNTPASNSDFDFGNGDFTIEMWINATAPPNTFGGLFAAQGDTPFPGYSFFLTDDGFGHAGLELASNASGIYQVDFATAAGIFPFGKWNHIAFVRNGSTLKTYVNGSMVYNLPINSSWRFNTYGQLVKIGQLRNGGDTYYYNGGLDEVRVSKGLARWTGNFTPPTYAYELTQPSFSATPPNVGSTSNAIQFTDTSPDSTWTANSFVWSFGDGFYSSLQNPTHTWSNTGVYIVNLTTSNNNMSATTSQTVGVGVPVVDFVGTPTTGTAALQVTFTDLTTNATPITSYLIDFGDGQTSTTPPPWVHVYSTFSAFSVNLTETNSIGSGFKYKQDYIVTSTEQNQKNTWYTPFQVRTRIVDFYGAPLPGTNVNVSVVNNSLPNTDVSWLITAFGIDATVAQEMLSGNTIMQGITDDNGGLNFVMFKEINYRLTITNASAGVAATKSFYPVDQEYVIYVRTAGQTANNNTLATRNATLPWYSLNSTYDMMAMTYQDPTLCTSAVNFRVWFRDNGTEVHNTTWTGFGGSMVLDNHTVSKLPLGTEYLYSLNSTMEC